MSEEHEAEGCTSLELVHEHRDGESNTQRRDARLSVCSSAVHQSLHAAIAASCLQMCASKPGRWSWSWKLSIIRSGVRIAMIQRMAPAYVGKVS